MLKTDLRKNTPRAASFPDVSLAAKVVGAQGRKGRGKDAVSPLLFLLPVIPRVFVPSLSCF